MFRLCPDAVPREGPAGSRPAARFYTEAPESRHDSAKLSRGSHTRERWRECTLHPHREAQAPSPNHRTVVDLLDDLGLRQNRLGDIDAVVLLRQVLWALVGETVCGHNAGPVAPGALCRQGAHASPQSTWSRCAAQPAVPADELRRPRARDRRGSRRSCERERLVTLVGAPRRRQDPPGLQVAAGVLDAFPDGVWLVELAPLADPALVPQAVADRAGRARAARPPARRRRWPATCAPAACCCCSTTASTWSRPCAALAEALLRACPGLHVLATSREPLAIDGEADLARAVARRPRPRGTVRRVDVLDAVRGRPPVRRARARGRRRRSRSTERTAPPVGADLQPPGRHPAGDRAGRRPCPGPLGRADRRPAGRPLPPADRRQPDRAAAPADAARRRRLELRPALRAGAALLRRLAVFAGGFTLEAAEAVGRRGPMRTLTTRC